MTSTSDYDGNNDDDNVVVVNGDDYYGEARRPRARALFRSDARYEKDKLRCVTVWVPHYWRTRESAIRTLKSPGIVLISISKIRVNTPVKKVYRQH
ncbi:hypothetical protein PGB90_005820 [Kerria lacca]